MRRDESNWACIGLRRPSSATTFVISPGIEIDDQVGVIWRGKRVIALTPKEHQLIKLLLVRQNELICTDELIRALYGRIQLEHARNRLKTLLAEVRRKLGKAGSRLRTARGRGLVLYTSPAVTSP